ncbi:MAG: DNA polymerase III subunit beta [Rubrobacteraceae bacterium]
MKVKAKAGVLSKLLAIVARAVPAKRTAVPILSAVLIEAKDGVLKMSATDMEISIALGARAPVEEEGSVAVPARVLLDILKSLPDEEVLLAADGKTASVSRGKNAYELVAHDNPDAFPKLPAFPSPSEPPNGSPEVSSAAPAEEANADPEEDADAGAGPSPEVNPKDASDGKAESSAPAGPAEASAETVFSVPTAQLVAAVKSVFPAVSSDDQRPVLTGVFFSFGEGRATMAATDGYRLAVNEAKLEGAVGAAGTALIPGRALRELVKLCELGEEANVALTENAAIFSVRGVVLSTRLIDGNYPAYEKLLPEASEHEFTVEAESLKGALRRVSLIAGWENPPAPVQLSFSRPGKSDEPKLLEKSAGESPGETAGERSESGAVAGDGQSGELTITVKGAVAGRATETVAADVPEGAEFASCFNPLHLLKGAEVIEAEKIRFLVNDPQKPVLLSGPAEPGQSRDDAKSEDRPGRFVYLAMPRRDPEAETKAETSPEAQAGATNDSEEEAG